MKCKVKGELLNFIEMYKHLPHLHLLFNKSGVKRLNTLGHLDQYIAQHGCIVKQSYCETVLVTILFNSN